MVPSVAKGVPAIENPQWERFFSVALETAMALLDRLEARDGRGGVDMARELQTSLLPAARPPGSAPDVAWLSEPADEVGGDFYDVLAGPHGDVFLLIGDVSGRGPIAALFMAMSSCLFRILAPDAASPGWLLSMANRILHPHLERRRVIITAQCARYRPSTGRLSLASAGHLWPYALTDGRFEELRADGVPLGIFPGSEYPETVHPIVPGSRLVMYTDGIVESRDGAGAMYGFDRLAATLEARKFDPPESLVRALADDVRGFAGGKPGDDVSVVAAAWS